MSPQPWKLAREDAPAVDPAIANTATTAVNPKALAPSRFPVMVRTHAILFNCSERCNCARGAGNFSPACLFRGENGKGGR